MHTKSNIQNIMQEKGRNNEELFFVTGLGINIKLPLCHSLVRSDLYSTIRTYQNAISLQKEC
jgi:hypothetical protein